MAADQSHDATFISNSDPILRPCEAARYVGLSISTLAKMRIRDQGPRFVKLTARAVGYRLSDLTAWLAEKARDPGAD